ncbi:hypothetical protein [Hymenobacter sp.]|uniref:hypothetical protein n=1 Tax=Hymenobacter sp. TaxID=1898978 RepID=UPI002EDB783C
MKLATQNKWRLTLGSFARVQIPVASRGMQYGKWNFVVITLMAGSAVEIEHLDAESKQVIMSWIELTE